MATIRQQITVPFMTTDAWGRLIERTFTYESIAKYAGIPHSTVPNKHGQYYMPTPWSRTFTEQSHGVFRSSSGKAKAFILGGVRTSDFPSIDAGDLVNRAMISAGDTKANWAESLAEAVLTGRMIAENVGAIAKMVMKLRKGDVKGAAKAVGLDPRRFKNSPKDASSKYLELIFGWRPLMEDVYTGAVLLSEGLQRTEPLLMVTGYAGESHSNTTHTRFYDSGHGTYDKITTYSTSARTLLRFVVRHSSDTYVLNQYGLANPIATAWDLVPMSFVIDWFIPVGNFLKAATSIDGLKFQSGYTSIKREASASLGEQSAPGHYGSGIARSPGSRYTQFTRVVHKVASPQLPRTVHFPDGIGQAITAIALATQRSW